MRRGLLGAAVATVLLACLPSEPCACVFLITFPVSGTVADAAGAPRAGVKVMARLRGADCAGPLYPEPQPIAHDSTDAAGRYELSVPNHDDRFCFDVVAWPGNPLRLEDDRVTSPLLRPHPDGLRVDLRFPAEPPLAEPALSAVLAVSTPDSVRVTTILRNPTSQEIRFVVRSPCTIGYRALAADGAIAWDSFRDAYVPCKSTEWERTIAAGDSIRYSALLLASHVRNGPTGSGRPALPPGSYTFQVVLPLSEPMPRTLIATAGTAVLR